MRKIYCVFVLLLLAAPCIFAQDTTLDTATPSFLDTQKVVIDTVVIRREAVPVINSGDSALFYKDLEAQQKNPEVLYVHKFNSFILPFIITLVLLGGIGIYLLFATGMCRDLSYDPKTNLLRPVKERTFSYSRVQLLWWSLIVLVSYTSFYFYTGQLAAITPTIVLLLGGGIATSMFGKVIDNSQIQENNTPVPIRHQDFTPSGGLLHDILSDDGGISIHRFQAVVLNLVFGFGYISAFLQNVKAEAYPFIEFEPWQLTLLGISAAGYLGFKANENSSATKLERQIETVHRSEANAPTPALKSITPDTESLTPPPPTGNSSAYEELKSKLHQKGMLTQPGEPPTGRDINKF